MDDAIRCAKCGYDLTGMVGAGRCPECGNEYDLGYGRGVSSRLSRSVERGDFLMRRMVTIALLLLTLGIAAVSGLAAWGTGSYRPLLVGGLVAAVTGLGMLTSYLYERGDD
ncbi:MAG: hypothetical protein AAF823_08585 [Planctomycetota bacterium]